MKQAFENLTISQLRKLTKQYGKLEKENKFLKLKIPTKESIKKDAQEIINEIGRINEN